jgi:sugar-specific transcriptional regulator TrmB
VVDQEKECQLLTKLGLTSSQAKVYLTLVKLGTTTAKAISAQAQIDRADVYRVVMGLQKQSLVEKIIANPLKFRPIPIRNGVNFLLERKDKENAEIRKQASLLIKQHRCKEAKKPTREETIQFTLIPPKEAHMREISKLICKAQSVDSMLPSKQFYIFNSAPEESYTIIRKFLKKGGKLRMIICGAEYKEEMSRTQKILQNPKDKGSFQIRYSPRGLVAALAIFDRKKLWIDTRSSIPTHEQPNLLTNSPIIVELAVRYFERAWKEARSIKA